MNRRQFLKGAAAGCALCAVALTARRFGLLTPDEEAAPLHVGPCLAEGLTFVPSEEYTQAFYNDVPVFSVNRPGERLIRLADGSRTLEDIVAVSRDFSTDEATADFFLTLAQAGWLQDRLEVYKVAVEA